MLPKNQHQSFCSFLWLHHSHNVSNHPHIKTDLSLETSSSSVTIHWTLSGIPKINKANKTRIHISLPQAWLLSQLPVFLSFFSQSPMFKISKSSWSPSQFSLQISTCTTFYQFFLHLSHLPLPAILIVTISAQALTTSYLDYY